MTDHRRSPYSHAPDVQRLSARDVPRWTPATLKANLVDGQEIAVLDVRETGVFFRQHLLLAASAPLWRLEHVIDRLVPRRSTRVVLVDHDESLVHQAAHKLHHLGWTDVSVLAGGTQAWVAAGYEVFSGTNVPSKAFGEVVEHLQHTPSISADELAERVQRGDNLVVVDSRTQEEFTAFSLPFAHSVPGAELVYRIGAIAPDPTTTIVVNCAGRTRSIIGAQTLIDAGLPNPVMSLRNGTMDWLMSGRELAYGRVSTLPEPSAQAQQLARQRAQATAQRAGVQHIDQAQLHAWQAQAEVRSLYCFDVRTRQEYVAGHLEGWRWAPGGQLVQAIDEYAATRGARVVLADWDGVRAWTTATWLAQQRGWEVAVYTPEPGSPLQLGAEPVRVLQSRPAVPYVGVREVQRWIEAQQAVVFDVDLRAIYERNHIAGARFCVPDRLEEFVATVDAGQTIVLTSPDGTLAATVAAELAARTSRLVHPLLGGTQAWAAAGLPLAQGADGVLTGDDDHWYSPYHHRDVALRDAGFHDYLNWELGLVAQLQRDGDTAFELLRPAAAPDHGAPQAAVAEACTAE